MRFVVALMLVFAAGSRALATPEELWEQGHSAFERALELAENDQRAAETKLYEAIAAWAAIHERHGVNNHRLHLNIGNAALLRGDTARAVLEYRRAERIQPHDPRVRAGLERARELVRTNVPVSSGQNARNAALAWRGVVPRGALLGLALAGWLALWGVMGSRLWKAWPGWNVVASVCAIATAAPSALLLLERHWAVSPANGVVTSERSVGFNGPSRSVYGQSFSTPMSPGVEFVVDEQRDGWLKIRLAGNQTTWVPRGDVELLDAP